MSRLERVSPFNIQPEAVGLENEEAILVKFRKAAQQSLWYFAYHCCGYKDVENPLHIEMANRWQARSRDPFTMWLIPRSHLKTSLWTVAGTLWELVNNRDLRFLIISARWDNAVDIIAEIRSVIDTNEMFRKLFPEFCPDLADKAITKRARQTTFRIDIPCSKWVGRKEGSIMCTSTGASMVGKHFDRMIFDDAVNDENTTTRELRDKSWNWYLNMLQIRDSTESCVRVVGTRWHYDDWYGRIIKREEALRQQQIDEGKPPSPRYKLFRLSCYNQAGEPIWPERFGHNELEGIRADLTPYIFSCQYLNEPVPEEDATFRRDQIRRIEDYLIPESLNTFMAVDLADEETTRGDYCVITVASFDEGGRMYVRDMFRSRSSSLLDMTEQIWRLCQKYSPIKVGIETVSFQKALYRHYKHQAAQNGWNIPFVEMKRGNTSKFKRILALQPRVERGDFYVVDPFHSYEALEEEMAHFPKGAHDDILDTLADLEQLYYSAPRVQIEPEPEPNSFNEVVKLLDGDLTLGALDPDNPDLSWSNVI